MSAVTVLHVRCHRVPFEVYRELFVVLGGVSPMVQALPPDSALVDVSGALRFFRRTPAQLADLLQTRIAARYGLTVTVGGGPNRMIASMAAETCAPGGVRIVADTPAEVAAFLGRQPVVALPGVGPVLAKALDRYGLETVADLRALPLVTLQRIAGAGTARLLSERARGIDPRTVSPTGPPATISGRRAFDHDVLNSDETRRALLSLAVELGARLRQSRQAARSVELQITYADRSTTTRSRTLREATSHTPRLQETLYAVFSSLGLERARIRGVTARVGGLTSAATTAVQLTFDRPTEDARTLEPVLDRANARFGMEALRPAALTKPAPGRRRL